MEISNYVCLSVGPVGPRGGIYFIEDVVCQEYFIKTGLEPHNYGGMQFCLSLWAVSGPEVGYIPESKQNVVRL